MNQNIPPKETVTGSSAAAESVLGKPFSEPTEESGALVSIHNAALHANPDSFPVLKAFQDYLETERKRARQRLVMLSTFFAILLVMVMLALIGIGVYLFGKMSKTQDQLLMAVLEQRSAPVATPLTEPARPAVDPEALAQTIEKRVVATLAAATAKPAEAAATVAVTSAELNEIKAALAALQRENEALKAQPKRPPTVGPIIPRAEIAHLLDPPGAKADAAPPPAAPVVSSRPLPPPPTAPAPAATPVVTAVNPTPPPPPAVATPAVSAAPKATKPLAQPSTTIAADYHDQAERMTIDIPSKDPDTVISWRVVLPPR